MTEPAPHTIHTFRLLLRKPRCEDADAIFARYASDPQVTKYVGWPRHTSVDQTRGFLAFSESQWAEWPAGPYLIVSPSTGELLGATGLGFETRSRAQTGYVLATDAWGRGFATEALIAMCNLARLLSVVRLYAVCHADHRASARVMEKAGMTFEGRLRRYAEFPNLAEGQPQDVLCYAAIFDFPSGTPEGNTP
jgi:RimJ/RimL family protein N-acetyltransferase